MTTRRASLLIALLLISIISLPSLAQSRRNQQRQQQQAAPLPPPPPRPAGPAPRSPEEADAFNVLAREQAPDKKIELSESFIGRFPESEFMPYVQSIRFSGYAQAGKHAQAVTVAEQAIDATQKFNEKLIASADADAKLTDKEKEEIRKKDRNASFYDKNSTDFQAFIQQAELRILGLHQAVMQEYQQLDDSAKVVEWGEKTLKLKPGDLNTLLTMSNVMAERAPSNEQQKAAHMARAEGFAYQALASLPGYMESPEAAKLPANVKSAIEAQAHYTLGLILLHQKKLGQSQQEFLVAVKAKSDDPVTYYRLGLAYVMDAKNDLAMDSLAKSVFLKGVAEAAARDALKDLWVLKNKSEQGMDDYIKAAGAKISQ